MATVTVTISMRRTDGRNPVDVEDLATALVDELESAIDGTEFVVTDQAGEEATYEVTGVRARAGLSAPINDARPEHPCSICGRPVVSEPGGRPRLYDTDACRQAAYRARR